MTVNLSSPLKNRFNTNYMRLNTDREMKHDKHHLSMSELRQDGRKVALPEGTRQMGPKHRSR